MVNIKFSILCIILSVFLVCFTLGCTDHDKPLKETTTSSTMETTSNLTQDDVQWAVTANDDLSVVDKDIDTIVKESNISHWQLLSKYADNMAADSQKAINNCNSYEVSNSLKSTKDEYNLAMEQAVQAAMYAKKGAEEANKENDDEVTADFDKASECLESYNQHLENAYYVINPKTTTSSTMETASDLTQDDVQWIKKADKYETKVYLALPYLFSDLLNNKDTLEDYSNSASNTSFLAQQAIDISNSYEVSPMLQHSKDKYIFAMELIKQCAGYTKIGVEEAEKGNNESAKADINKASKCMSTYFHYINSVNSELDIGGPKVHIRLNPDNTITAF